MPLGNLTSQFFANVYLNELDQFIKHKLKIKYYIRYVDDFVILHNSKEILKNYQSKINEFLKTNLKIELHPEKSSILKLNQNFNFLGFRIFSNHKLVRKRNWKIFKRKLGFLCQQYDLGLIDYDKIYDFLEGWLAYTKHANTYKLRKKIINSVEEKFASEISTKEINRCLKMQETCD